MSDELRQLRPVDYKSVLKSVFNEMPEASVDQMVGRGMQIAHGAADPHALRLMFTIVSNAFGEIGYTPSACLAVLLPE